MVKSKAIFIDLNYKIDNNKSYIELLLKLKNKKTDKFLYEFYPYFYVDCDIKEKTTLEKIAAKNTQGEIVKPKSVEVVEKELDGEKKKILKITCNSPSDVVSLRSSIPHKRYESQILFIKRFLLDSGLKPFSELEFEHKGKKITKILNVSEPKSPSLSKLSFDIETYNPLGTPRESKDPIIMISYMGSDSGVLTYKKVPKKKFVKSFKDEQEIIKKFCDIVSKEDPDIIYGYNSTNFDIPYLQARAEKLSIPFELGRWESSLRKLKKGLISGLPLNGRLHLDLYPMMRFMGILGILKSKRYTLEAVYNELGKGKKKMVERRDIWKMWDNNELDELSDYSLMDAETTYELGGITIDLFLELSKLTGLPLFETTLSTSGQLVEFLLMKESVKREMIIPPRPKDSLIKERISNPIEGAFVKLPSPGIYENIAVMDFRGLYPSIIISYNIDPYMLTDSKKNVHISPMGWNFKKSPKGLVPSVLKELVDSRAKIKRELKKLERGSEEYNVQFARSNGYKIISNSFYGYLGYARSRWYNRKCAESVTAWGREHIKNTIKKAEEAGFKVLYGDSLPYDRYIFVKDSKNIIDHIKIGDFVTRHKNNPELRKFKTLAYDGSKLVFKPILRAIKHGYDSKEKGKLLKFITTHGKTIVTPQHSIYYFNKNSGKLELANAKELKVGDYLVSLTNPKLSEVYKIGDNIDVLNLDFGPFNSELRVYADSLRFPPNLKGKCPYCEKIRLLYSHISLQHYDRKLTLNEGKKTKYEFLGGKNAGVGRIPRYWKLTKELAWIMGYYCADGSASEKSKVHDKQMISFGSQDKKIILRLKKFFDKLLKDNLKIIEDYDKRINKKMYYYRVQRAPIVALFKYGFKLGGGSTGKRVPALIYSSEEKLKLAFLRGYLDGDGNQYHNPRYKTHFTKFSTKSKELAMGLQLLFKSIPHSKNSFGKKIEHIHWRYRNDKPRVQSLRLQGIKSSSQDYDNYCLARIKEVNKISNNGHVFDLEVDGAHNFVDAEGLILVHNTDSVFLLMGKKSKEDVLKFLDSINSSLPEDMELELEGFYPTGVFVGKKSEEKGAKKKYALLADDGSIKIRGFELVRRDWSPIAKYTQKRVLEIILKEKNKEKAAKIVKDTIKRLKSGEVDLKELVIYTQITKDPRKYDIMSPEVSAAKKMLAKGIPVQKGSVIGYVVGRKGKSISEKAEPIDFAKDYDPDYYINNQVLPSVMKILKELGFSEDDLKFGGKQTGLGKFF